MPTRVRTTGRHVEAERSTTGRPPARRAVLRADLSGFAQVPPVLTPGRGTFQARLSDDGLEYELTYEGLTSDAMAAHIHFGHPTDNGGILAFLCGGTGQACPLRAGTVRGTLSASDILGIPEQGVAAGDVQGVLRIVLAGLAYVNVHTQNFPDGEIRGQIRIVR